MIRLGFALLLGAMAGCADAAACRATCTDTSRIQAAELSHRLGCDCRRAGCEAECASTETCTIPPNLWPPSCRACIDALFGANCSTAGALDCLKPDSGCVDAANCFRNCSG